MPELRNYQMDAVMHIIRHPRCAIFADCGLGKTAITLTALRSCPRPLLVLAPKRVALTVWEQEAAIWAPELTVSVVMGTPTKRAVALRESADVYVTSYDTVQWLAKQGKTSWGAIVCDESTRLRGFRLRQGAKMPQALALFTSQRFIELTGTPAPQSYADLYGQIYFLDHGQRLGRSLSEFRARYMVNRAPAWANWPDYQLRPGAKEAIDRAISDLCLSLRGEDWLDLREPLVVDVPCHDYDRAVYKSLKKELVAELHDGQTVVTAANAAVAVEKLLQVSSGFLLDESGKVSQLVTDKLEALQSIIDETGGEPIVAVYRHKAMRDAIVKAFPQAVDLTPQSIAGWNAGKVPLLLLNPASAGHGLNLQHGGRTMVWVEGTFNLEHYLQTLERLGPTRQLQSGYNRQVRYYRLIATPVERYLYDVLAGKTITQDSLMEALSAKD